jgi:hypothetical protein
VTICDANCEHAEGDECRCRCRGRFHNNASGRDFDYAYGANVLNSDGSPGSVVSCRLGSEEVRRELAKQVYAQVLHSYDPIWIVRDLRDVIERHLGKRSRRSGDQYWRLAAGQLPSVEAAPLRWSTGKQREIHEARRAVSTWTTEVVGNDLPMRGLLERMMAIALAADLTKMDDGSLSLATSHCVQVDAVLAFIFLVDAEAPQSIEQARTRLLAVVAGHEKSLGAVVGIRHTVDETLKTWGLDKQSEFRSWHSEYGDNHDVCTILLATARALAAVGSAVSVTSGLVGRTVEGNLRLTGLSAPLATLSGVIGERVTERIIGALPPVAAANGLLPVVRGLAVRACPDLGSHREISEECLMPLLKSLSLSWLRSTIVDLAASTGEAVLTFVEDQESGETPNFPGQWPPPTPLDATRRRLRRSSTEGAAA